MRGYAPNANTDKGSTGYGYTSIYGYYISGNDIANAPANSNILSIRTYKGGGHATVWLLDEDGDVWQEGFLGLELATTPNYHIHAKSNASVGLWLEADADDVTETDTPFIYMTSDGAATKGILGNARTAGFDPMGNAVTDLQANALCFHKLNNGSYLQMAADSRAFLTLYSLFASGYHQVTVGSIFNAAGTEFYNANMTVGLNICQGANDDEILALKSSDVAHGCTDVAETDTFGLWSKVGGDAGGLRSRGFSESQYPFQFMGYATSLDTTKTTAARATFESTTYKISGTGITNVDADSNLFAVRCYRGGAAETVMFVDEDGDIYYDGALNNYDDLDDAVAVRDLQHVLTGRLDTFLKYNEDDLVKLGVIGAPLENGGMVSHKRLTALVLGAIAQMNDKIDDLKRSH